jgi:dihydrofolate reductase
VSKVRVNCFAVSLDGFGAGPRQSLVPTRTFQKTFGKTGGTTGPDDDFAARGMENIGAWILGRNMFSPIRGPWPDDRWKGWWGDNPPYHTDVFVLTHHARKPQAMEGGTVFHFVTDGIDLPALGFRQIGYTPTPKAAHYLLTR